MPDASSFVPVGPIVETLVTTYLGDGDVTVDSVSVSSKRHNCQDDDQIAAACPPTSRAWKLGTFQIRTYAFTNSFGYVSQSFDVFVHADTDGCDVFGAFVYAANYNESTVGHDESWRIKAVAVDSPYRRPTGCSDCCSQCASVALLVSVSAPAFHGSYLVRVFGNGTFTRKRLG